MVHICQCFTFRNTFLFIFSLCMFVGVNLTIIIVLAKVLALDVPFAITKQASFIVLCVIIDTFHYITLH